MTSKRRKRRDDDTVETAPRKIKMRKWWVNRLHGRTLKLEIAEDDQLRYKKRFKKDGPKEQGQQSKEGSKTGAKPTVRVEQSSEVAATA